MAAPITAAKDAGPAAPLPGARTALILLLAINLFNYIDRQVLAAIGPKIKRAFLQDDPLANTKFGALTWAFVISYMVLSPVFGWLADRMSRWLLVAIGVMLWSLASGASGLATAFMVLLITRCFVGIGEAAYGPAAPAMIADLYPVRVRGSVLAWFYAAIPVGGALGYLFGGLMADSAIGWRWAFYLVVPPGILLGVLCFLMREPARGQTEGGGALKRTVGWRDYRVLARIPSYVLTSAGMTAMTFAVGGIAVWMPTYVYERESRFQLTAAVIQKLQEGEEPVPEAVLAKLKPLQDEKFYPVGKFREALKNHLTDVEYRRHHERLEDEACSTTLGSINLVFGAIVALSGLFGTVLGGLTGDALRRRFSGAYFLVSGVSMFIAFPMILLVVWTPFPLAWVFVFLGVFLLFFNTGPTNTILANVAPPAIRASAFAINIFLIHALGDAISPLIMGQIADHYSMDAAFSVVSLVVLVGGVLWMCGMPHLERDTHLAPKRLSE